MVQLWPTVSCRSRVTKTGRPETVAPAAANAYFRPQPVGRRCPLSGIRKPAIDATELLGVSWVIPSIPSDTQRRQRCASAPIQVRAAQVGALLEMKQLRQMP